MNEGKKDRRDPIRTIKARNPVAKNATSAIGGGAAGAHKDKKKAAKQGDVKHKKAEYAESYEDHLKQILKTKLSESQTFIIHFADMDTDETDTASVVAPDINTARKIFSRENPELYIERIRPAGTQFARHDFGDEVDEAEDDKVRELTTMEYRHISHLAREAGIVLGGLGADKVTGDLHWSGTKDGRNVSGVVKRTVSDEEMDREEEKYKAELQKDADYRAYRKGVVASRKQPPTPLPEGRQELTPYEAGEADGLSNEPYENPYPEGSKSYVEFRKGYRTGYADRDMTEGQLDELSPDTLKSYIKKSKGHSQKYDQKGNKADEKGDEELANKMWHKGDNRYAGAEQARVKLADLKDKKKGVAEGTVNPQFVNVQVTKILAREAQRMTNVTIEQLLAPLMKEYNLTLLQINSMVPGGLKKAAAEYGVMVKGIAEDFDSPEYNDEAGMAQSNLYTLARAVKGLLDTIEKEDNLPEWAQEKIAKSEMMLVSVWDYLLSQKSQGIDPKVSEASALEKFRKGSAEREKKHADIEAKRKANPGDSAGAVDRLAKHMDSKTESLRTENPCWKGYKPVGTKKKGGKTVPNCVPKEGWTHDSLADQLFEHERTYEEKLQNQLNNKLGK